MLTLLQLELASSLPPTYRAALDRHCRRISRHTGAPPDEALLMELTAFPAAKHPRRRALAEAIVRTEAALAAAQRGSNYYGSRPHLDMVPQLSAQLAALRVEAAELGRLIAYAAAFEAMVEQVRDCVGDDDILALMGAGPEQVRETARRRAEIAGQTLNAASLSGAALVEHRRRCCPTTRARRLRKAINLALLAVGVTLGEIGQLPGDRTQLYAPNLLVARSRQRDAATKEWAATSFLTNGEGLKVPMTKILKGATERRFITLWSLTRACEQIAERRGLACLFLTLSLPAAYHRNPSQGRQGGWVAGLTPVAGIEELQHRWQLIRARLQKEEIAQLGLWTQEPHEDGTPHRHLLIWAAPDQAERLIEIYRSVFNDTHEDFEGGVAVNVKRWNTDEAARPSSYVMKYIVKTFSGGEAHVDRVEGTERHVEHADRVAAWRRGVPGKRSYGFVGLVPGAIGVWGKVASLREEDPALKDETFGAAHAEIRAGKFGNALVRLGLLTGGQTVPWAVEQETAVSAFGAVYWRSVRLHSETGGAIELHKDYEILSEQEIVQREERAVMKAEREQAKAARSAAKAEADAAAAAADGQASANAAKPGVTVVVNYPRADAGASWEAPPALPPVANEGRSAVA